MHNISVFLERTEMRVKQKIFFLILFQLFIYTQYIYAYTSRPYIYNVVKQEYNGGDKNWSVDQDERGIVYFANDKGLLEFDGIGWELYAMPRNQTARSVAVLSHATVFTGSYEEFGRWDRDVSGKLLFTSLSDKLENLPVNEDFWKIHIMDSCVYFQSFSAIYRYDYKTVQLVSKEPFLYLLRVGDELFVQKINSALYKLIDNRLQIIANSEFLEDTDVRVVLPYVDNQYLIGTTSKGVYVFDGKTFRELNPSLTRLMVMSELNSGILTSRQTYLLGTIANGIYEIDVHGNVLNHISTSQSIQNNTIHALYEDNANNIWVALDKGLAYIQYLENMQFFIEPDGLIGAVYDAILWRDQLFLATNQGVYYAPASSLLSMQNLFEDLVFINGTQGQTWSFSIIDGRLFCGHNKGVKEIQKNYSITEPYHLSSGVYNLKKTQLKKKEFILLSTYNGLEILDAALSAEQEPLRLYEQIINVEVDHLDNIWLEHFYKGVYKCRLKDGFKVLEDAKLYGGNSGDGLPYKLRLFKIGGRVVLFGDDRFYTYNDLTDLIVPDDLLNECFKDIKHIRKIVPIHSNMFWAITDNVIYKFLYDGYQATIIDRYKLGVELSPVYLYENIAVLTDSLSLICLDNGFLLYKETEPSQHPAQQLYFKSILASNASGQTHYYALKDEISIPQKYNSITFNFFANMALADNLYFQYKLAGVDEGWSEEKKVNSVTYERLPKGEYTFYVKMVDSRGWMSESIFCTFEIRPFWYQTAWAIIGYVLLFLLILYLVWLIILRYYKNIDLQRKRYWETKQLKALTDQLQNEIQQKNAELLTQTSFIIQKNELIHSIKNLVEDFYTRSKSSALTPLYHKINALLNKNMNSGDDWKTFLIKFEEKHAGFFKKMKDLCPELTSNDLRLCACLRLNMETKEIASLMNLSVRAVENNRYRLRKKLKIASSESLTGFIINIE